MNVDGISKVVAGWDCLPQADLARVDENAFSLLVERQARFVFRVAFAVVRNVEDAEDVVQETFLKLFRTAAWKTMKDEKAFLARTAWRVAISKSKTRMLTAEFPSRLTNPESELFEANWQKTIHSLIDALPEKLRQPLALLTTEELNTVEITAVLGIPEGTVRRRILRARQLLREKMERLGVAT